MHTNNVLHVGTFNTYICVEYLGTTEVETATAALNVADPSTADEGENGNCPYVYFYRIFPSNISPCHKLHVQDIHKVILQSNLVMYLSHYRIFRKYILFLQ